VDLEYLREHPHKLPMFIEHQRIRFTPVSGGSTSVTQRLTLDDGTDVFAKLNETGPAGLLEAEQRGLHWLAESDAPVPRIWCATPQLLVCEWVNAGEPTAAGAKELGRRLARLHRSGAPRFGAEWPGFIGALPMDNAAPESRWPEWFAARRLEPYLRQSVDNGSLSSSDVALLESVMARLPELAGPAEPVARLHGDLWPGNLHWGSDGRAWLIDPAAHGGHRETDLATLHMFGGAPMLDRIMSAYQDEWPLAAGWRDRIPLHQLFLLLVHTALFGSSYRAEVLAAARPYT
jgi:fructosamine-3-kinase